MHYSGGIRLSWGMVSIYKAVIRYKFITKGKKIIGVDHKSRQVEYLPVGEEGEEVFNQLIKYLHQGIYTGFEEWVSGIDLPVTQKREVII